MEFKNDNGALVFKRAGETVRIEAWGENSLRVRATMLPEFTGNDWALTEKPSVTAGKVEFFERDHWVGDGSIDKREYASITNGKIRAEVNFVGIISFFEGEKLLLREYYRSYDGTISQGSRCLKLVNREWKGIIGGTGYTLNLKFDANEGEKIYGMGQYQQSYMDMKGCVLELAQRNSQASVPFYISNKGYGMLWNNPAIGKVTFGKNVTEWEAYSTKQLDYWITAGDTPEAIVQQYVRATGLPPTRRSERGAPSTHSISI